MSSGLIIAIFLLAFAANLLLGLFVFLRDPKSATMRLFFFLIAAMNIWALFNFLSSRSSGNLLITRLVLFFAVAFAYLFFLFAHTFPSRRLQLSHRRLTLLGLLSAAAMIVALSPLAFKSIQPPVGTGLGQPVVGPGIGLFGLTVLFYDVGGLYLLVRKYFKAASEEKKQQFDLLLGLGTMLVAIIVLGFIFPTAFKNTSFIPYASAFMFPFVVFTAYAIVRHHFLDIRLVVARSVAYTLLLASLAAIYGGLIFASSQLFFRGSQLTGAEEVWYLVAAMFLAFTFQPLKHFFDGSTNRIFFREAYDTQEVLNRLGDVVASEINLQKILGGTRQVLGDALKSSFVEFILMEDHQAQLALADASAHKIELDKISPQVKEQRKEIVFREDFSPGHPLKTSLEQYGIAISLRLKTEQKVVGYILIGDKQSGYIYSEQDKQLLLIAADELAIAIQNALRFEEIRRFNVTLQEKVNDATKQLRHANSRLRELDKTKDEFISMASHQLRTPLTTIKGYLSMVLEGDVGPVTKNEKQMIQQAFDSAERMVFLIADLLNVSRLQSGKFVIESKPTDLAKMIETEVAQLQETATNHHLTLTYKKPDKLPLFNLDETKIRQVIMNFMDNAIYYTPAGGSVEVGLEATDTEVKCTVTDTGLGVPKAEQHHLFSKFYRAGNARKMRPDGTGLGLFMAKKVIVAQGGAIIFKSEEGKGSTFGFSFPRKTVELKEQSPQGRKEPTQAAAPV